jgi:O-antigen/teichoic acid export membrane protein
VLKPLVRFSGANYVGNVLTLLPTFIVPLVVLDRIGVHATAYYYIAYQVVSLLYAAVFAVEQTFLAEGSHDDVDLRQIMKRSWRLLAVFCVPASLLLALGAHWLLLLFGPSYSANGTLILIILAASALPLGAFNWLLTALRLTGQLGAIMTATVVFAALTCGLAWILAPRGLSTLVLAWPLGLTFAACTAAVPFWRWSRRHAAPQPQH